MHQLPPFKEGYGPQFRLSETVWVIQGRNVIQTAILAINYAEVNDVINGIEQPVLLTVSYDVGVYKLPSLEVSHFANEIYRDQATAAQHAVWCPCADIPSDVWLAAIGDRENDDSLDSCELTRCCSEVSHVRDLLLKCCERQGLIQRDVDKLKHFLHSSAHSCTKDGPNLDRIFARLGIVQPGS